MSTDPVTQTPPPCGKCPHAQAYKNEPFGICADGPLQNIPDIALDKTPIENATKNGEVKVAEKIKSGTLRCWDK